MGGATSPLTPNEIEGMRARIHTLLSDAQARAQSSGKPLLILVGEQHYAPSCALLEAMIYNEARALGIKDVALELDAAGKEEISKTPLMRAGMQGHIVTHLCAEYFNAQRHYVDDLHGAANPEAGELLLEPRNIHIASNLKQIQRPVMMVAGNAHVPGLLEEMACYDTHEVVAFDLTPETAALSSLNVSAMFKAAKHDLELPAATPQESHARQAAGHAIPTVHALQFEGDARSVTVEQLLEYGLGCTDAAGLIDWCRQHRFTFTPERAQKIIAKALEDPTNLDLKLMHAIALYESGQDAEAGKQYAGWVKGFMKLPKAEQEQSNFSQLADERYIKSNYSLPFLNAAREELFSLSPKTTDQARPKEPPIVQPTR